MGTVANPQVKLEYTFNVDLLPNTPKGEAFAQRIFAMVSEYEELKEEKRQSVILSCSNEHEAKIMLRRSREATKSEMLEEQRLLIIEGTEKDDRVRNLQFKLKTTQENFNHKWALPSEVAEHERKISAIENELNTAMAEKMETDRMLGAWQARFIDLQQEIQNIEAEVAQLWANKLRAEGHMISTIDRATGLRS